MRELSVAVRGKKEGREEGREGGMGGRETEVGGRTGRRERGWEKGEGRVGRGEATRVTVHSSPQDKLWLGFPV